MDAEKRIRWAADSFGRGLVMTTSFGTYAAVMLDLVRRLAPGTPIISINTGFNNETLTFGRKLTESLSIKVHQYDIPEPEHQISPAVETLDEYLKRAKISILEDALQEHGAKVWMSGVLSSETEHRRHFDILMKRDDGLFKFHPLLDWHTRDLYRYCENNRLPINDDYFDPLKGADQNKECGIHLTGTANQSFTASQL